MLENDLGSQWDERLDQEEAALRRRAWRISILTIAAGLFLFGLIVMPGLMMRLAQQPGATGHYAKRLNLTPGEELLAQYGPAMFPNNKFTNLKGDWQVACEDQCFKDEYFIGVQSKLLYHGLENVASGKPERPATNADLMR